jgi:hypothetical protein
VHTVVLEAERRVRIRAVTAEGKPLLEELAGARCFWELFVPWVVATPEPPPAAVSLDFGRLQATSPFLRNDSDVHLPTAYLGELVLREDPPLHVSLVDGRGILASRRLEAPVAELEFVLARADLEARVARLELRLVDAARGEPLTEGLVGLRSEHGGGWAASPDQDGRVSFWPCTPGTAWLVADTLQHAPQRLRLELPAGGTLDLGTLVLGPPQPIAGRVLFPPGGAREAEIHAQRLEGGGDWSLESPATEVDLGQGFELDLGEGAFALWARGGVGRTPWRSAVRRLEAHERVEVELVLEPAARLVLLPRALDLERELSIRVRDEAGVTVHAELVAGAPALVLLPPGEYSVELHGSGGLERRGSVRLGPEGAGLWLDELAPQR